ncbi:MAG TPA: hypothetical protein VGJ84_11800 [Polyangiaceae bacterium]
MLAVEADTLRALVRNTIGDIAGQAETMRLMARNLEDVAGELVVDAQASELRQVAGHVRAIALTLLMHSAAVVTRVGALEAFGDVRKMAEGNTEESE